MRGLSEDDARSKGMPGRATVALVAAAMLVAGMPLAGLGPVREAAASHVGETEDAEMATGIDESSAVWTGSAAYVFGGRRTPGSGNIANITKFDPDAGTATVVGTLPAARRCMAAVWTGSEAYVLGGTTDSGTGDQQAIIKFTPSNNQAQQLGATLGSDRNCPAAVWAGGSAYVFGGCCDANGNNHGTVVKFTPPSTVQTLTPTGSFPSSLRGIAWSAVTDGTYAYIFGGDPDQNARMDFIVRYHLANNNIPEQFAAKMPTGRYFTSAVWDGSAAHILGAFGCSGTCENESVKFVPPSTVTTTTTTLFPTGGRGFTSAVWDGTRALIFGGSGGHGKEIVDYNPNNRAPVAAIAALGQQEQECIDGDREVTLDGRGSSDADGDTLSFKWSAPGITFDSSTSSRATATFALGGKTVTLEVDDGFPGVTGHTGTTTRTVTVADTIAPVTSASLAATQGNAGWLRSNVTVTFTVQDQCGGTTTKFRVDGGAEQTGTSTTVTGDGTHAVTFFSSDSANVESPPKSVTFKVDTKPPVTSATIVGGTQGDNGWFRSAVDVSLTATDATSGVAATKSQLDNGPVLEGPSATVSGDGDHALKHFSVDVAGNTEATKSLRVPIDTVPPVTTAQLSGVQGNNGWWRSDVTVDLVGSDATSGVAKSFYRLDGGEVQEGARFTAKGEGQHTFEYFSKDLAGNVEAMKSGQVRIDMTPPTVTLEEPENNRVYVFDQEVLAASPAAVVVGDKTVLAMASDPPLATGQPGSGMHRVELVVDGSLRGTDFASPYALPWASGRESARIHNVTALAYDQAGNSAPASVRVLTVPTTTRGILYSTYDCTNLQVALCNAVETLPDAGEVCRVAVEDETCEEFVGP